MEFLVWHYSQGVLLYLARLRYAILWLSHYFSLSLLLPTLFVPWKRLVDTQKTPGFNLQKWFERVSYNFVSRIIGACVRLVLFMSGIIALLFLALLGSIGIIIWLVFPPLSLSLFSQYKQSSGVLTARIIDNIKLHPERFSQYLFDNAPGRFILTHLALSLQDITKFAKKQITLDGTKPQKTYTELLNFCVKDGLLNEDFLRSRSLLPDDFLVAASWWETTNVGKSPLIPTDYFGRPGIGLDLLFGYTPTLNKYSVDLGLPQSFSHHLIGRHDIVARIERTLTAGSSILITGLPGVGKKTVVLEFARRAAEGQLGKAMVYQKVMELDYNFLLSGGLDLNQKKVKLAEIFAEASGAGNIILVIKDMHRITNSLVEGIDFTDILEQHLEKRTLKIISLSSRDDYERFIAPNVRLRKFFETIDVVEPTREEALIILTEASTRWEKLRGLTILVPALRKILEGSDQYISETPFPEKAIELLDAAVTYVEFRGGEKILTVDDVNAVLAEKTGISFARLTESEKTKLGDLEGIIHKKLINQDTAVTLISKVLRAKSSGVIEGGRPLGSFLFLGPTGVGKTETAKVLAEVYYGSEEKILRFDMAEYGGREGLERLIGSVDKNMPGVLTTGIKNHPASLLLLDEIEKAPPEIANLFLTLLDEGTITDAFGKKINCQHLFVVATSNAGAEYIRQLVSQGEVGEGLQKKVVEYVLQNQLYSPEFLNRFDGVVVYEPLKTEHLEKIAALMLEKLAKSMKKNNLTVAFSPDAIKKLATEGYDPAFGARPMRRIIEVSVGDTLGKGILAGSLVPGDSIVIDAGNAKEEFNWKKVSTSA